MDKFLDCWLMSLTQIAGGPGPAGNVRARFALLAILWAVLLASAWSGQRHGGLPRERLPVWGFGQALAPVVMIAGSFLRYILVDVLLARLHVQTGLQGEYP